jgi:tRNA (guanine-N7-)-methyltransferase
MITPRYAALIEDRRRALGAELTAIFPRGEGTFHCEIGCGHGHFLTAFATANPTVTCIGIDLIGDRIDRARRKRDRAKLRNLHFIQAEARLFLEQLPAGVRIARYILLFPDPWPKLRHHKNRILQADFLTSAAQHAAEGCRLYFRTDFRPYYDAAAAAVVVHPEWETTEEPWIFEHETVFQQRAPSHDSLVAKLRGAPPRPPKPH